MCIRDSVQTVLLVYLEADDGSQAHAQRTRHAEKAQALPAAVRGDDIHGHRRTGGGHAAPDQALHLSLIHIYARGPFPHYGKGGAPRLQFI